MKENNVERWMVDKDGDVIDVRSKEMVACLVDVSVPTRRGRLIAAAPEMYELVEYLSTAYDDRKSSHDLASTLYDLRCMALRLRNKIEGGENVG